MRVMDYTIDNGHDVLGDRREPPTPNQSHGDQSKGR